MSSYIRCLLYLAVIMKYVFPELHLMDWQIDVQKERL